MDHTLQEEHERVADVLGHLDSHEYVVLQNAETSTAHDRFTRVNIEIGLRPEEGEPE